MKLTPYEKARRALLRAGIPRDLADPGALAVMQALRLPVEKTQRVPRELYKKLPPMMKAIVDKTARAHGIGALELFAESRRHDRARLRWQVWLECRHAIPGRKVSITRIGEMFGRDHSTISQGLTKLREETPHD